jgi:hypothetical protein
MMNFDTGFLLADSQAEFSSTQGNGNWYYYWSNSINAYNELTRSGGAGNRLLPQALRFSLDDQYLGLGNSG